MIAKINPQESVPEWHEPFLQMLAVIERLASLAFRDRAPEAKEDLTQEVVVNAMQGFKRLYGNGQVEDAHPSVLARYAIPRVCEGSKGGNRHCCREMLSEYAQKSKGLRVDRLDYQDHEDDAWHPNRGGRPSRYPGGCRLYEDRFWRVA